MSRLSHTAASMSFSSVTTLAAAERARLETSTHGRFSSLAAVPMARLLMKRLSFGQKAHKWL